MHPLLFKRGKNDQTALPPFNLTKINQIKFQLPHKSPHTKHGVDPIDNKNIQDTQNNRQSAEIWKMGLTVTDLLGFVGGGRRSPDRRM